MGTASLLWRDPRPAARRYDKSVAALEAVALALQRNRPLDGDEDEFLSLHRAFVDADRRARATVWGDPQAHFWVRRAYQLVAATVGGAELSALDADYCAAIGAGDATDALRLHLEEFKRFVIALHVLTGHRLKLARPYRVTGAIAVPGTPLALAGGDVAVHGVAKRRPVTERGDAIRLARAPVVRVGGTAVTMQMKTFALPGLPFSGELASVPPRFQRERTALVRRAVTLVERHERGTFATLRQIVRVVALKPRRIADFANLSHSELPGAIVCSAPRDPHVLAAALVHEIHHHRLFVLEDTAPAFEADDGEAFGDGRFYSPWREDLRPLHGILHAVYVYLPTLRYLRSVAATAPRTARDGRPSAADFIRDRLARVPAQLRIGTLQLERYAHFTTFGRTLFREMSREVANVARRPRASADVPAIRIDDDGRLQYDIDAAGRRLTVRDSLVRHLADSDLDRQCSTDELALDTGRAA